MKVRLKDTQQVIARASSEATDIKVVENRGYGKTWTTAWIAIAIAILYANTPIIVVSATAQQATLVIKKIASFVDVYPELLPQIKIIGRDPVIVAKDSAKVMFKNGSSITSGSISSVVGSRAKLLILDEQYRIPEEDAKRNASPLTNYTRDICIQNLFEDFPSKTISITSACRKSNYFYGDFCVTYNDMKSGNKRAFACALDYNSAVRVGITKAEFFEERRRELPEAIFATEYESMFVGDQDGSVFPFELVQGIRTLKRVEYAAPKGSTAWYVLSLDIATSAAKGSDNAICSVFKCVDKEDGTILRQLVYMRSYNGKRLDELADEVRRTYVRFPNIKKIVFDQRGLGDSFPAFFQTPWVDEYTDREYPPWCLDIETNHMAEPLLYSFKATVQLNQELVTKLRVAIEQKTLTIPIDSRTVEDYMLEDGSTMKKEDYAIFVEADALQIELSNLVAKTSGATGNVLYDVAKSTQHKDRFSSLAMGNYYISLIEAENKRYYQSRNRGDVCIGLVDHFIERR